MANDVITEAAEPSTDQREEAPSSAPADAATGAELVEDELLVEEVSIDGMCGVY